MELSHPVRDLKNPLGELHRGCLGVQFVIGHDVLCS